MFKINVQNLAMNSHVHFGIMLKLNIDFSKSMDENTKKLPQTETRSRTGEFTLFFDKSDVWLIIFSPERPIIEKTLLQIFIPDHGTQRAFKL